MSVARCSTVAVAMLAASLALPPFASAQTWRSTVPPSVGWATSVARVGSGDAVVAGSSTVGGQRDATAVRLDGATGVQVWRRDLAGTLGNGFDELEAVATGSAGGVFVAGRARNAGTEWDFTVAKLSAADGSVAWRRDIDGAGNDTYNPLVGGFSDSATTVAVDALGDAVVGGFLVQDSTNPAFLTVVKLSGATGATLWQHVFDPGDVRRVAVDAAGDVFAVGTRFELAGNQLVVLKLAGATGTELWRYETLGEGIALAVDALGNVTAGGVSTIPPTPPSNTVDRQMLVVRLAGATGTPVWRTDVPGAVSPGNSAAMDVALDGSGNVVAGGFLAGADSANALAVLSLDGATGGEVWRRVVPGACCNSTIARVAIDPAGDVVAAGTLADAAENDNMAVLKLAGADGTVVWERSVDGGPEVVGHRRGQLAPDDFGNDLVLDTAGNAIVAGSFAAPDIGSTLSAAKFAGASGGDYLLAGSKLRFVDHGAMGAKLSLGSKARILPPVPLASTDPTVGGASLEIENPTTHETATIALPASGWAALGTLGFRYTDHHVHGPCTKIVVTSRRLVAHCSGTDIGFTLDEPSQGALGVRFRQGTAGLGRCLLFGGSVLTDTAGSFVRTRAPAPADCLPP